MILIHIETHDSIFFATHTRSEVTRETFSSFKFTSLEKVDRFREIYKGLGTTFAIKIWAVCNDIVHALEEQTI